MDELKSQLLKNFDRLLDIKAQNHDHFQKMEKNQKEILLKMANTSNKVSLIYFLFGAICGVLLAIFYNDVINFINPLSEVIKAILNLKRIGEN